MATKTAIRPGRARSPAAGRPGASPRRMRHANESIICADAARRRSAPSRSTARSRPASFRPRERCRSPRSRGRSASSWAAGSSSASRIPRRPRDLAAATPGGTSPAPVGTRAAQTPIRPSGFKRTLPRGARDRSLAASEILERLAQEDDGEPRRRAPAHVRRRRARRGTSGCSCRGSSSRRRHVDELHRERLARVASDAQRRGARRELRAAVRADADPRRLGRRARGPLQQAEDPDHRRRAPTRCSPS